MGVPPLQTFQQPGPLDQANKALQFRTMMGNQQLQQQQVAEGDIALQQKQQDMKDQQTIRQLFIQNQGDMDKTLNDAISAGVKPQTIQQIKSGIIEQKTKLATLDKTTLEGIQKRTEIYGQTTGSILALPPEQRKQAAAQALPGLVQQGVVKPEEAQGLMQQLPQMDDQALEQFLKLHQYSAMATDKQVKEIRDNRTQAIKEPGEIGDSIEKANKAISQTMGGTTNAAAWKAKRAFLAQRGMDVSQVPAEYSPEAVQQMKNLGMPGYIKPEHVTTAEGVYTTNPDGTPNKRIGSPAAALVAVNQLGGDKNKDALDLAADNYRKTGQMPPGLSRTPQTITAIIQRAAAMDKEQGGMGIAANKADLESNRKSLDNLQKNFDQVSAFEQTARKNLQLMLDKAEKVPELGARFANTPIRAISANMIGTKEMAEFKAALATAQAETAKVLNSSNASGVLSDTARKELEDIISGNLPYGALKGQVGTFLQDMDNRHQSYKMQIDDIRGRIKGVGNTQSTATPQGGGKTINYKIVNGQLVPE